MANEVITNKTQVVERCVDRIKEEYDNNPENLENSTKQDSIILNIQRACEASIDLAMHVVSTYKLGLPQNSREAFDLLARTEIISETIAKQMKAMVGFRNIAIHDYQSVNLVIVQRIIDEHLNNLMKFCHLILKQVGF